MDQPTNQPDTTASPPFSEAEQAERRRCLERLYDMRRNDEWPAPWFSPKFLRALYEWAEMPRPVRVSDEIDEYDVMWWGYFKRVAWGNPEEKIAELETLEDPRAQTVIAHIRWVIDGPLPVEPQLHFYMSYWTPEIFRYIRARLRGPESPPTPVPNDEPSEESRKLLVSTGMVCPTCRRPFGRFVEMQQPRVVTLRCQACGHRWYADEP